MGKDIRNQSHYNSFQIQPAKFSIENDLSFAQGNVVKYVCRYKYKNGLEDLEKARHYIDMLIEYENTGELEL